MTPIITLIIACIAIAFAIAVYWIYGLLKVYSEIADSINETFESEVSQELKEK